MMRSYRDKSDSATEEFAEDGLNHSVTYLKAMLMAVRRFMEGCKQKGI